VPIEVSIVAVYRFDGSIPISGAEGNFWVFGAEPSSGGKGKVMPARLQVQSHDAVFATELP
jgi:hypothetical protein